MLRRRGGAFTFDALLFLLRELEVLRRFIRARIDVHRLGEKQNRFGEFFLIEERHAFVEFLFGEHELLASELCLLQISADLLQHLRNAGRIRRAPLQLLKFRVRLRILVLVVKRVAFHPQLAFVFALFFYFRIDLRDWRRRFFSNRDD